MSHEESTVKRLWFKIRYPEIHRAISEHAELLYNLEKKISEVEQRLEARLVKLEKIERITANVARERAQRPKNWTQFRTLAEGAEEPNVRG